MNEIQLEQIAREVCAELPGGWTYQSLNEPSWTKQLRREDGAELWISNRRGGGKWNISSGVDVERAYDYLPYQKCFPSINVSQGKPASVIARDIERRILPELEELLGLVMERKHKSDAHNVLSLTNANRLSALVGHDKPRENSHGYEYELSGYVGESDAENDNQPYAHLRINGDRMEIKVDHLSVGQAEALLRIAAGQPPYPSY